MSAILKSTTILSDLWNCNCIILYGKYSNEWYAKDTSKKIRAVFRAKGMSGKRISTQEPYGYLRDETNHLVLDEETAPVVKLIFQLCAEGNGPGKIARILQERKISTPRTIDFLRTGRSDNYDPDNPCSWSAATISCMLDNKEYLGHTVNFKTTRKSYKNKKVIHNSEEKQVVFENTHEAIIDSELWEVVQRIRKQRHRPTRAGSIALFSGILFCADCGGRLGAHRTHTAKTNEYNYICSKYRNSRGVQNCTAHYIREDVLKSLVLDNLRSVISYARAYENEFVQQLTDSTLTEQAREVTASKRQLEQHNQRISEIDSIIQRLYEDVVKGTLTEERFTKMCVAYEQEQKKVRASADELQKAIDESENCKVNIKSFLRLVKSYIEPEELTPEILRMFVDKIVVHETDKSNGQRIQQVDIHYNFVGQLEMSVGKVRTRQRRTPEEIAAKIIAY